MARIQRELMVPHSAAQMYSLVNDVERYSDFLPWCVSSRILHRDTSSVSASLSFAKGSMQKSFSTKNTLMPPGQIHMTLLEGPFKHLSGMWTFHETASEQCRVALDLEFEFSNRVLAMMFGPMFHKIAQTMVVSFSNQANQVYA